MTAHRHQHASSEVAGNGVVRRSAFERISVRRLLSLILLIVHFAKGAIFGWGETAEEIGLAWVVLLPLLFLLAVWFGDVLVEKYHEYIPLRTGFEVFAKKNAHEDQLVLWIEKWLVVIVGWAGLVTLVFLL